MIELLIFFASGIVCALFTAGIAGSKGRSVIGWLVLALIFPFISLLAVGLMPNLKDRLAKPTPETHVKCPDCKEFVLRDARKCKHCGTALIPYNAEKRICQDCKSMTVIGYGYCSKCSQKLN